MAKASRKRASSKIILEHGSQTSPAPRKKPEETPFNLAILGDFSGQSENEKAVSHASFTPVKVDIDNFEGIMGRMSPRLELETSWGPLSLNFEDLEAFHPDALLSRVSSLASLTQLRQRLKDPASASQARSEVIALLDDPPQSEPPGTPEPSSSTTALEEASSTGFEELLERPAKPSLESATSSGKSAISDFVESIIKDSGGPSAPGESAADTGMIRKVEEALAGRLQEILHHPSFQALEASWRGVDLLVRRIDSEEPLNLYLINLPKKALAADLMATQDLTTTQFYQSLIEHAGISWAVFIGDYDFFPTEEDAILLSRLGILGLAAGAPLIAGASPELLSLTSFETAPEAASLREFALGRRQDSWATLCQAPVASYLGLALPRFLLRLPYGSETEPIERLDFEELSPERPHENYLWGNAAYACAHTFIEAFLAQGWKMNPLEHSLMEGLPVHAYTIDGETRMKPCAECWLSEHAYEILSEKGLIPLVSIRNRDAVRLFDLPSVAQPPSPLVGAWT